MKDNKNIFCDKVCSYIDYATGKELEQVHGELRDHLEDHAQALMEIGRSRDEAEEASILAMGDPEEMLMYGKVSQENYVELTAASAIPNKEIKSPQILRY